MQEQLAADGWDVPTYHQGQSEQQYNNVLCPACEGGDSREDNASVKLLHEADGGWCAMYTCWRKNNCGVSGRVPGPKVCPCVRA